MIASRLAGRQAALTRRAIAPLAAPPTWRGSGVLRRRSAPPLPAPAPAPRLAAPPLPGGVCYATGGGGGGRGEDKSWQEIASEAADVAK